MLEFSVGNRADILRTIIPFFDANPPRTQHRYLQYQSMRNFLGIKTSLSSLNKTVDTDWLSGFIDAEGCFYVGVCPHPNTRTGIAVLPKASAGFEDRETLEEISLILGCGRIRKRKDGFSMFEVSALADCIKVTRILPPLRTTKSDDLLYFTKILDIMSNKGHLTENGLFSIRELKAKMNKNELKI